LSIPCSPEEDDKSNAVKMVTPGFRQAPLELAKRLEQLRLLENGIGIYVEHTAFATIGVDTEQDLLAAERVLQQQHSRS
jgi:CMP-2-keto-3-deoxyoctulosonic acid synthetase